MRFRARLLAPIAAAVIVLGGCASMSPQPKNTVDPTASDPESSALAKLMDDTDLVAALGRPGSFTVFARTTNAAFAKSPARAPPQCAAVNNRLRAMLTDDVVPGAVMAADVEAGSFKTVQGGNLAVSRAGNFVGVEQALVKQSDFMATKRRRLEVDTVLIPPSPGQGPVAIPRGGSQAMRTAPSFGRSFHWLAAARRVARTRRTRQQSHQDSRLLDGRQVV